MKVTNIKTNQSYELPQDKAEAFKKSGLAKRFKIEKPAATPPEVKKETGKAVEKPKPVQAPAAEATKE